MHKRVVVSPPEDLECTTEMFFPEGMTFPQRVLDQKSMQNKDVLEMMENRTLRLFDEETKSRFANQDLNLYEENIETWRQLWRVMERSTVLLFIVDIRFAVSCGLVLLLTN